MSDEKSTIEAAYNVCNSGTFSEIHPGPCSDAVALDYIIETKDLRKYADAHPEATVLYVNAVLICECGKRHRLRFGPD